jgi:predicted nucleotidyltransferase
MHMDTHTVFPLLSDILNDVTDLELAVLIGSRATGACRSDSDWDIAIQWIRGINFIQQLSLTEQLRRTLAKALAAPEQAVDLIDLPTAGLTMRAVVAEEGIPLKGGDSLAWRRFMQRTWRQLEEHYWEQIYAA